MHIWDTKIIFKVISESVINRPVVHTHFLGRYFNAFNAIDNRNRMQKSDLELEKYWVIQGGYFVLATTVALGMGITDVNHS